jgi:hypothetical protein
VSDGGARVTAPVTVRNGGVENDVTIESGRWRRMLHLQPGETRALDVPRDPSRASVEIRIRSSAGFRPSDVDTKSRDTRLLGVFVKIGD